MYKFLALTLLISSSSFAGNVGKQSQSQPSSFLENGCYEKNSYYRNTSQFSFTVDELCKVTKISLINLGPNEHSCVINISNRIEKTLMIEGFQKFTVSLNRTEIGESDYSFGCNPYNTQESFVNDELTAKTRYIDGTVNVKIYNEENLPVVCKIFGKKEKVLFSGIAIDGLSWSDWIKAYNLKLDYFECKINN